MLIALITMMNTYCINEFGIGEYKLGFELKNRESLVSMNGIAGEHKLGLSHEELFDYFLKIEEDYNVIIACRKGSNTICHIFIVYYDEKMFSNKMLNDVFQKDVRELTGIKNDLYVTKKSYWDLPNGISVEKTSKNTTTAIVLEFYFSTEALEICPGIFIRH